MRKLIEKIRNLKEADYLLVIISTILVTLGVVMVFSASYYDAINTDGTPYSFLRKQAFFAASGFLFMMVFSIVDYHKICRGALFIAIAEIILLLLTQFTPLGVTINGATRWLKIPVVGITIMPGEIAKFAIIVLTATMFAGNGERVKTFKGILPLMVYTGIVCGFILKQPNLSTAITVGAIAVGIAFLAGMKWSYVGVLGVIAVGGLIHIVGKVREALALVEATGDPMVLDYKMQRIVCFLDPFKYEQGVGYQVSQSLMALGSGGLRGVGLGMSVRKNLYLPEPQNDFILSIIGEEMGFVGIAIILILFALLVWRLFIVAVQSRDRLGTLLVGGIGIMIGVQVVFNIAVVTSSMPPTGVALPFISYGGNAIWIMMVLMGIALNVSRQMVREKPQKEEVKTETKSKKKRKESRA